MGTIGGLLLLALIAYLVKKNTGLHLHEWLTQKIQQRQDKKNKDD